MRRMRAGLDRLERRRAPSATLTEPTPTFDYVTFARIYDEIIEETGRDTITGWEQLFAELERTPPDLSIVSDDTLDVLERIQPSIQGAEAP